MISKAKVIVSGVSWTIVQNLVSILYGVVSVPFLINYFGKGQYGLIGLALSVNVYLQLMDMGLTSTNVKFLSEYLAKGQRIQMQKIYSLTHLIYLVIGLLNTFVLFILSFYVDDIFNLTTEQEPILRHLLLILALNATFSWVSECYDQFLRAYELVDWIKRRATILKLAQFFVLFLTILLKLSIEIYFFMYTFVITLILPLTILKAKKIAPDIKYYLHFDKELFKQIYPFALSIFSFSIFQFLALNSRPLIIGNISGAEEVAEYNIMYTITMVVMVFSNSFMQVLIPIVSKMKVSNDIIHIKKIMSEGTKYVTILLTVIILLLILSLREVLCLYVGESYVNLSKWLTVWLLVLLLSHRNVMTSMVFTETRLNCVMLMGFCAMVIAFCAYFILIPYFGVGGVVIGFALHELIHTLFYYLYFMPTKCNVNALSIFFKSVLPVWIFLGVEACLFVVFWNNSNNSVTIMFLLKFLSALIVFFFTIWFLLLNREERLDIRLLTNGFLHRV